MTAILGALFFGLLCFLGGRFSAPSSTPAIPPKTNNESSRVETKTAASVAKPLRENPDDLISATPAWNESQWRDLLARPGTVARNAALAAMLEALAATDPAQAIALAQAEGNRVFREQLIQAVLHGWARTAPMDAVKWVTTYVNPLVREAAFTSVFAGAVAANPAEAVRTGQFLIAQNPGEAVGYGGHLIDALCDAGQFEMAAKMAVNGDRSQRASWLGEAYSKWAALQPEQAAQAAAAVDDPVARNFALHGVVGGWAEADPPGLIQFVSQLPADEEKNSMLSQALQRWTKVDLKAASEWINHNEMGAAMDEAVSSVAAQDNIKPDVAVSWAESVVDPKRRSETLVAVLRNWATSDLPAARRYFDTSDHLLPEDRQEIAGVISTLSGESPASAPASPP
jgi:hypothetical protein